MVKGKLKENSSNIQNSILFTFSCLGDKELIAEDFTQKYKYDIKATEGDCQVARISKSAFEEAIGGNANDVRIANEVHTLENIDLFT